MANGIRVDTRQLKAFRGRLEKLEKFEFGRISRAAADELANRLRRKAAKRTPVDTGTLKAGWTIDGQKRRRKVYRAEVTNPVPYATYVEFGHIQTPGRYVPAIGKRLKSGWVHGHFMLDISTKELRRDADRIVQKMLDKALKEYFDAE